MLSYFLKCKKKKKKNTESMNPKVIKLKMVEQSYYHNVLYVVLKKSKFIKKQEASGMVCSLCLKTPLSKIPF